MCGKKKAPEEYSGAEAKNESLEQICSIGHVLDTIEERGPRSCRVNKRGEISSGEEAVIDIQPLRRNGGDEGRRAVDLVGMAGDGIKDQGDGSGPVVPGDGSNTEAFTTDTMRDWKGKLRRPSGK